MRYELLEAGPLTLYMRGTAPSHVVPNYIEYDDPIVYDTENPGMLFGCMLKLQAANGTVSLDNGRLPSRGGQRQSVSHGCG